MQDKIYAGSRNLGAALTFLQTKEQVRRAVQVVGLVRLALTTCGQPRQTCSDTQRALQAPCAPRCRRAAATVPQNCRERMHTAAWRGPGQRARPGHGPRQYIAAGLRSLQQTCVAFINCPTGLVIPFRGRHSITDMWQQRSLDTEGLRTARRPRRAVPERAGWARFPGPAGRPARRDPAQPVHADAWRGAVPGSPGRGRPRCPRTRRAALPGPSG